MGPYDKAAVVIGICSALVVLCGCKGWKVDERLFFAFGNGSTATYMAVLCYGIFQDVGVRDAVMASNSVLLFGAMLFTAIINLRGLGTIIRTSHQG